MEHVGRRRGLLAVMALAVLLAACQERPMTISLGRHPGELAHNHPGLHPEGEVPEVDLQRHQRLDAPGAGARSSPYR